MRGFLYPTSELLIRRISIAKNHPYRTCVLNLLKGIKNNYHEINAIVLKWN